MQTLFVGDGHNPGCFGQCGLDNLQASQGSGAKSTARQLIRFLNQINDLFLGRSLTQESPERIPLQVPEDVLHRGQMLIRIIRRTQQQHDNVHRRAIQSSEVHPVLERAMAAAIRFTPGA
jgi:hypothetical protein